MTTAITDATMYDEVTRLSTKTVIVKCGAVWCAPCKQIQPEYAKLAGKFPNIEFYTVDVEQVDDFKDYDAAKSLPTFFIFKGGSPVGMIIGAAINEIVDNLVKL